MIWPHTKSGEYTVKSRYAIKKAEVLHQMFEPASTSHKIDEKVWKDIWSIKIPTKVKLFLWRIFSNGIPYGYNLWQKKILSSPTCIICGCESKTIEHALLTCECTKAVWFDCGLRFSQL